METPISSSPSDAVANTTEPMPVASPSLRDVRGGKQIDLTLLRGRGNVVKGGSGGKKDFPLPAVVERFFGVSRFFGAAP